MTEIQIQTNKIWSAELRKTIRIRSKYEQLAK